MHNTANVYLWGTHIDDHVKNITYLMDRNGKWSLAPAYDECYAYNPEGDWTSQHQMSVNGKRIGITDEDIIAAASFANIRERKARAILDEVKDAVQQWSNFAVQAEVRDEFNTTIAKQLKI